MPAIDTIIRFIIAVLFNGLWEAALLAIVAWIALRAMPNANATTRHSVLVAALLASLILPVVTAVVTTWHPTNASPASRVQTVHATVPVKLPKVTSSVTPAQATPEIAAPSRANIALPRPVMLGIVALWLLGALFVLVRLLVSLLHLERLKKDALPVAVEYRAQLARWNAATKGSRTVRLCRSGEIAIPIAVGLFDAMILIPERFLDELEPADVDSIVLHELAHLRRADDWINAIERLASALLFFNPGIAWLVAQLDLEREVACDDWVLQQNDPLPYANCLAKVVETAVWPYRAMSAPGAFLTRRAMSVRIERLLTAHRDVRVRTSLGPTGIVVAALAVLGIGAALVSPSFAYTVSSPAQSAVGPPARRPIAHAASRQIVRLSQPKPQTPVITAFATAAASEPPAAKPAAHVATHTRGTAVVGSTEVAANSPAYIDELASAGYTNLTVDQLVQLKAVGVTADYIRGVENAGLSHPSVNDLIRLRAMGVQPDYIRSIRQRYGATDVEQIVRMKAVGVTPEYVAQLAQAGYPNLTADQLAQLRAVGVDGAFVQRAAAHGFRNLSVEQLIRLKTSDVL
ncbi:MAG TPA: M56 family metallopeptidase [Candidatus Baltobacteraceae bacterium]|jgi:beta-lactamase regulating signal transducer with metallopeptidase domain|nr:M56 family metallopeptidase [Candidatus Baltobacteraceae bacterium]